MRSLVSVFVIAAKDLAQRGRDRSAYVMGLFGPLALALIMGATLGGADDPDAFDLALAVEEDDPVTDSFRAVLADLEDDGVVRIRETDGRRALDRSVDNGDVGAGFHLAAGFGAALQSGDGAAITVVGDPGSPLATDVAEAVAETFAAELDYVTLAVTTVLVTDGRAADGARVAEVSALASAQPATVALVPVETEGRGEDLSTYYAVSLSVFFLFFSVQFGVLSLLEERELGTLDRILMAPIGKPAVMVGKMLSSLAIGVASMSVLVVATSLIGGAAWGDPIAVGALIVVGVAVAIAVAMLVAAVARTAEQAVSSAAAVALLLGLLGGVFFPISRAGGLLAQVSWLSPHRWLVEGFRDVSYGAGVGELGVTMAVLGVFIVIGGGLGLTISQRRLVRS